MQIQFSPADGAGRTALRALADPGDRPLPVDRLLLDAAPQTEDSDLTAAAATLLFAPYADLEISFGNKITSALAAAIQEATGLTVTSEVFEPPRTSDASFDPVQVTTLVVALGGQFEDSTPDVDRTRLRLVPGERFQGALFGVKESVIASNAWYLARTIEPRLVQLAVGLLFARDFLVRDIKTSGEDAGPWVAPAPFSALSAVLGIGAS